MEIRDILHAVFRNFFITFAGSSVAMVCVLTILSRMLNVEIPTHHRFLITVGYLFISAAGTALTHFVFYAKSELSTKQLYLRYFLQWALVVGIMLVISRMASWGLIWVNFLTVAVFIAAVTLVFALVHIIETIQTKIIVKSLNKELLRREQF